MDDEEVEMRKGEKLIDNVGKLLSERTNDGIVLPENIYYYIQYEMSDEEFDKIMSD